MRSKRQVRLPKVHVADTGILHTLLGIESRDDLLAHPKMGASWEGFVLSEVVSDLGARPEEIFFWATHFLVERRPELRGHLDHLRGLRPRVTPGDTGLRGPSAERQVDGDPIAPAVPGVSRGLAGAWVTRSSLAGVATVSRRREGGAQEVDGDLAAEVAPLGAGPDRP